MLRTKFFSGNTLAAGLFLLGIAAAGCNMNKDEKTVAGTDNVMDTSSAMKVDTSGMGMKTDTSSMSTTAAMTPASAETGMAKPNASKKGMKGKATITAPTKGTGAMEMDNTGVYSNVEYLPSYPGGNKGLQKFFDNNLEYPVAATDDGVEGTVNVSFIVDENGKLTSPKVEGQNLGYGLETEALRVVNKMPVWNPGKLKGKNVKTRFTLPIVFQLY